MEDSDFTLRHIFGQGFSFFTNLDSKLYNTIRSLFLKPGALTKAYIEGRRKNYMKPFQVFVLSSVFFYIFMSDMDVFLVPSQWYFTDELTPTIEAIMAEKNITWDMAVERYDRKVVSNSKLFIFALLPFFALLFYAFNWKKEKEFGKYLILAVYQFSFFLVLAPAVWLLKLIPAELNKWWAIGSIIIAFITHMAGTIRRVFKYSFGYSLLQSFIIFIFFVFLIAAYRSGISYYSLMNI